jgi:hypothetical protein
VFYDEIEVLLSSALSKIEIESYNDGLVSTVQLCYCISSSVCRRPDLLSSHLVTLPYSLWGVPSSMCEMLSTHRLPCYR